MFELTTGTLDRPFRDRRVVSTIFSVMTHLGLLGVGVAAALFVITDELPEVRSMVASVAEVPAPPPPPPPAASAPRPKSDAARSAPAPKPGQLVMPVEVPAEIAPESGIYLGEEGGVPGGVEGGIPGGVLGGVLGGLMPEAPPPLPELAKPKPIRIGGDVQPPALVHYVAPIYPEPAVWANSSGLVILEASVNERGDVTDVKVLRSIKLLDQAAIDAVKQWRYKPVLLNGIPHPFILTVTVTFSIRTKK